METEKIDETIESPAPEQPVSDVDLSTWRSYDQSLRVKTGNDFNHEVTKMLRRVENGSDIVFIRPEPVFEQSGVKRGFKRRPTYLQMDHEFIIVDHDKRELLCVLSDGSTTFRNDRAKIKRSEGIDQMNLKPIIETHLLSMYPQYKDYTITHLNIFVFPSKMRGSLKSKAREAKMIRDFCVNTNYSLNSFRSTVGCHQIDAAMTIDEMEAVINELTTNKYKYSFTQNAFANAWKNLYSTFDYLPTRELTIENATNYKDQLLYSMANHANDYERSELIEFAKACGISPWRKTWTNKAMIRIISKHIVDNF